MDPFIDCPWRLVVSDLDGTLVTGTTACAHIGAWIGHEPIFEVLEARLARGEISDREVAESYAPFTAALRWRMLPKSCHGFPASKTSSWALPCCGSDR